GSLFHPIHFPDKDLSERCRGCRHVRHGSCTFPTGEWEGTMARQCAWCKGLLGQPAPLEDRVVTHGICAACSARLLSEAQAAVGALSAPPASPTPAPAPACP